MSLHTPKLRAHGIPTQVIKILKITAENMAFLEDNDIFNKISFNSYNLAVFSKLNSTFVADMNFPVEAYLNNRFARCFGRAEENIFLNGIGINEPTGLL